MIGRRPRGLNCWEPKTNDYFKTDYETLIETFDWQELSHHFDVAKMTANNASDLPDPVPEQPTEQPQPSELKLLLDRLSQERCDGYNEWLRAGMALYDDALDDDALDDRFELWDDWSTRSEKYKAKDNRKLMRKKWKSFANHTGPKLTLASLRSWATTDHTAMAADGEDNKWRDFYNESPKQFMAEINKELMYQEETNEFISIMSDGRMAQTAQSGAFTYYKKLWFLAPDHKGKMTKVYPLTLWLEHRLRRNVLQILFEPLKPFDPRYHNQWDGYDYQKTRDSWDEAAVTPFVDHIKNVWADGDERQGEYILDWFAQLMQHPNRKPGVCLMIKGRPGVGKNIMLLLFRTLMGERYFLSTADKKDLFGDFTPLIEGRMLINPNEAFFGGDLALKGKFKEFVTEPHIVMNKKGISQYVISNHSFVIAFSNETNMWHVDNDDRRVNIMEARDVRHPQAYYKAIAETDLQELANYFYNRVITTKEWRDFPVSEFRIDQIERSMSTVQSFWHECLKDTIQPWNEPGNRAVWETDAETIVRKSSIYCHYQSKASVYGHNAKPVSPNTFWKETWRIFGHYDKGGVVGHTKAGRDSEPMIVTPLPKVMMLKFNETMENEFFKEEDWEDPITVGKSVRVGSGSPAPPWSGQVGRVKELGLRSESGQSSHLCAKVEFQGYDKFPEDGVGCEWYRLEQLHLE